MAGQGFDTTECGHSGRRQIPKHGGSVGFEATNIENGPGDDDLRYRLDIIAQTVLDVVESAGGWLFDRTNGGMGCDGDGPWKRRCAPPADSGR